MSTETVISNEIKELGLTKFQVFLLERYAECIETAEKEGRLKENVTLYRFEGPEIEGLDITPGFIHTISKQIKLNDQPLGDREYTMFDLIMSNERYADPKKDGLFTDYSPSSMYSLFAYTDPEIIAKMYKRPLMIDMITRGLKIKELKVKNCIFGRHGDQAMYHPNAIQTSEDVTEEFLELLE